MKRCISLILVISLVFALFIAFPVNTKAIYKAKIACVGDSITYGYGLENAQDRFSDLIAAKPLQFQSSI